ncbi:MAG: hypothetical protein HPY60_10455 [Candidatus Methanofastidiosum sp.]|nr:hypothetical protein [Methanofastidiosum sp.]
MCDFDPDELIKFTTTALKVAEMTLPAYSCNIFKTDLHITPTYGINMFNETFEAEIP